MGVPKIATAAKPNIYSYHDYRLFIQETLAYLKATRSLSARELSRKIGLSHGYFSLVIKRQRNLSAKALKKISPFLSLSSDEEAYLANLIKISDGRTQDIRNKALIDLKANKNYRENHPNEFETHKYLDKWYYIAIRELSLTKGFQSDAKWIKQQLPRAIRIEDVEKAIDFLVQQGFLSKDSSGGLTPTDYSVKCIGGVFQVSLTNYHGNMIDMAKDAIENYSPAQRKQIGYTMALPRHQLDQAKAIIEEAKEKLKQLENQNLSESDTVYHVNLSAFPIAGKGCFE